MQSYYINPDTKEVHEYGTCSWQATVHEWCRLGTFGSLDIATVYARRLIGRGRGVTRCHKCVEALGIL